MKIGIAQINPTVGDLGGNAQLLLEAYLQCVRSGAELVLGPELALPGYPPRDLVFRERFTADNLEHLQQLAAQTGQAPLLVGFVEQNPADHGRRLYNALAWCAEGKIQHVARKCLLPSYDVFDEDRYFEPAREPLLVTYCGLRIGLTICEDIWNHPLVPTRRHYCVNPLSCLVESGVDLILNASASPWHRGKTAQREALLGDAAKSCCCPVVYTNVVGGNDELVFDGASLVVNTDGAPAFRLKAFASEICTIDLGMLTSAAKTQPVKALPLEAQTEQALVLGLRDYAHKSGFKTALLGLSGGIDSAVTAVIAARALGPENVTGISLPSAISSQHSKDDAWQLAKNLGIRYESVPIETLVEASEQALSGLFLGLEPDVTEENIQARARGLLLMGLSNKWGSLLLTTGNKSELAVGYCTLYGDMCGGLAVLSDLPKTDVFALARWLNRRGECIPINTIEKPPSAELRPDQCDSDSLPDYPVLDAILQAYVEQGLSRQAITQLGHPQAVVEDVCRKVDRNEYKRKQAAPGLKLTPLAFGTGRRIPIVQRYIS
jgi:NAD+ synthase (glutamine-hydrolysing)